MPNHGLRLNYDGSRVQVQATDRFRDGVRGLCGSFTGEKATDFITPRNCIVREAKDFVATYSLSSNNRDNSRLSNQDFCAPKRQVQFQQVINEKNIGRWADAKRLNLQGLWGFFNKNDDDDDNSSNSQNNSGNKNNRRSPRHGNNSQNSNENDSNNQNSNENNRNNQGSDENNKNNQQRGSSSHRLMVVEQGNQLCFSTKAMPQCNQGYRAENTVEKKIDAHCVQDGQLARQWKEQARRGEHIAAMQKKNPNKTITVEVPTKCVAA
ncbi:vitellogenin-1-like [Diaphorina citri]|uniref:Vitellogenin-1-like n=2 Tax=Diaphorina citri TaxID=121845 RepID=A0A1S3DSF8_DIACI|nr:vitellogenin-1-like [Diaphorina citri]